MIIAGYASENEVLSYAEEVAPEYGVGATEVRGYVSRQVAERADKEAYWPANTVNDRISAAFLELSERGIVALENAGYTMSDGWCDVGEAAEGLSVPVRGGCFFHWQDVERGVSGEGLLLAFGADAERGSREVAREICEVLDKHEVANEWDGDVDKRIRILPFSWQRRRASKPR